MSTPSEEDDRERERIVKSIARDFEMIARGGYVALRTVSAIDALQRGADYGTITAGQRDHLLQRLFAARAYVLNLFHAPDALAHASTGLDAVAALIFVWGETVDEIKARPSNTYAILHDEAEILRSACKIRSCFDSLTFWINERDSALLRVS